MLDNILANLIEIELNDMIFLEIAYSFVLQDVLLYNRQCDSAEICWQQAQTIEFIIIFAWN